MMVRRLRQFHLRSLVVLTVLAAILFAINRPIDRPSIAATQTSIDIGAIAVGTSGSCNFILENSGPEPIQVRAGGTGGTARIVGPRDYIIPNNSEQTIVIRWSLLATDRMAENKPLRWSYQMLTNDPKDPVINLSIIGRSL